MSSLNKKLVLAFLFIFMLGSFGFFIIDKATKSRINNIGIIGDTHCPFNLKETILNFYKLKSFPLTLSCLIEV